MLRLGGNAKQVRKRLRAYKPTERRRVGQQVPLRGLWKGGIPEARVSIDNCWYRCYQALTTLGHRL